MCTVWQFLCFVTWHNAWLVPIVFGLFVLAALLGVGHNATLAPFVYTLF